MRGLIGGVVMAVAMAGCGGGGGTPEAGRPAVVTEEEPLVRMHEAPSVVVDRENDRIVYLGDVDLASSRCVFSASTDGGRTWSERSAPVLEPYTDCGFGSASPKNMRTELEQGPDGTLYFLFHAQDPSSRGERGVLLGRSTDGGNSWETSPVFVPEEARSARDVEVNFVPHMAVDPDDPDRIVVIFRKSFPNIEGLDRPSRPYLAVSDDGGATFGEPVMMLDADTGFDGPRPIIVDDTLYAFYRLRPEDGPNQVVAGVSDDFGETWDETVIVEADDVSEPVPVHDPDTGAFHVVWHDNRNDELDAFYARSTDAREWTEPVRLNDDAVENRIGQFYPTLSLAADGRIDVVWYDYRDDPYPAPQAEDGETLNLFNNMGQHQSVYATSSFDGGRSWTANVRVNDVPIDRTIGPWNLNFFVQVPPSVASRANEAIVAWSDTRRGDALTGTQDIVVAPLAFDDGLDETTLAWLFGGAGLLLGAGLAMALAALLVRRRGVPTPAAT